MDVNLTSAVLATALAATAFGMARAADAEHPTVVELYQSQGCSTCPPADANLAAVAARPDILALSFAVTYWDRQGWKDTFASPAFTLRQVYYVRRRHLPTVYTPEVLVNGRVEGTGIDPSDFRHLISVGDRGDSGPAISSRPGAATIGAGEAKTPADVWLVRYDPRVQRVPIGAGENRGRTLPHRNIVRELTLLGHWTGAEESFPVAPPGDPNLLSAVLVQAGPGGPILAAGRL